MEFDQTGNFIQGWGGPGRVTSGPRTSTPFTWTPKTTSDPSAGGPRLRERTENQILKFTRTGKFLLQVGRRGMSKGSVDTENFNNAADLYVYAKTNEVFIADGYVNRRVIVIDADTGKFKRMWGAYGNRPDDSAPNGPAYDGPGPQQFNLVHGIRVSDDGLVYVAERRNNRMQVFTTDGKFVREVFVERKTKLLGTAFSVAFTRSDQQLLSRMPAMAWFISTTAAHSTNWAGSDASDATRASSSSSTTSRPTRREMSTRPRSATAGASRSSSAAVRDNSRLKTQDSRLKTQNYNRTAS
jgi:hypothetical protein